MAFKPESLLAGMESWTEHRVEELSDAVRVTVETLDGQIVQAVEPIVQAVEAQFAPVHIVQPAEVAPAAITSEPEHTDQSTPEGRANAARQQIAALQDGAQPTSPVLVPVNREIIHPQIVSSESALGSTTGADTAMPSREHQHPAVVPVVPQKPPVTFTEYLISSQKRPMKDAA